MLPSRSGILAEAINMKILTKNHPDSPHSHPDSPHSHLGSHILTLIPRIPTPIPQRHSLNGKLIKVLSHNSTFIKFTGKKFLGKGLVLDLQLSVRMHEITDQKKLHILTLFTQRTFK